MLVDNFFDDHPHTISTKTIGGKKWLEKTVDGETILQKEFFIQEQLSSNKLSPSCKRIYRNSFLEEFIEGKTLDQIEHIDNTTLKALAEKLQEIHVATKPLVANELFSDSIFLPQKQYDPKIVVDGILQGVSKDPIPYLDFEILDSATSAIDHFVQNKDYKLTIIHGDLSPSNVIIKPDGRLMIIDWTDCRLDVGIGDLTQAIHLFNLSDRQSEVLLSSYQHELNEDIFVAFQLFLYGLYDLVKAMRMGTDELPVDRFIKYQDSLKLCISK